MIKKPIYIICLLLFSVFSLISQTTITSKTAGMNKKEGYFNFYWDNKKGEVWLEIDKFDHEFLYVNSLAAGLGSNDIGLDRGQLGNTQIVEFRRIGPKVLMVQPNYDYRAISDNPDERSAVKEAFSESVLWGFKVEAEENSKVLVNINSFLLRDAHGISDRLSSNKEGNYKVDASRSAIYPPMLKNFPQNSEFEATVTFTGKATGRHLWTVTPNSKTFSLRMHHSFIQLPDDQYKPRKFDPRTGYLGISYMDYATPIQEDIRKRWIIRHRLEKKKPKAKTSEPVEPIIYYVDRGAPEPVKSALTEGASWWNQAFEAAGYQNAFIVKEMPADADPMDVRYNLIQWVHRSTRGWSYGGSVVDPRTGEIIKGHVSLGSLRVRQDFLIAQGLLSPYEKGITPDPALLRMALARLRQLSAHEVGHTIGLAHNFASTFNGRASVMDYPHPYIQWKNDKIDLSEAYDTGIGEWDKAAVTYGYQDFPEGTNEQNALNAIIESQMLRSGLKFITDSDARPQGGAHPYSHLWDNGKSATEELNRLIGIRKSVLNNFSESNIPQGTPLATLEEVLVPMYMMHRYQLEATAKLVGGAYYAYNVKGDGQPLPESISAKEQNDAINSLLNVIKPENLAIPENVLSIIPPRPPGYGRSRETFEVRTGVTFDPVAPAESIVGTTLKLLFHPQRATRLTQQKAMDASKPGLLDVIEQTEKIAFQPGLTGYHGALQKMTADQFVSALMKLATNGAANVQARAEATYALQTLISDLDNMVKERPAEKAFYSLIKLRISQFLENPIEVKIETPLSPPDGSPIGSDFNLACDFGKF